LALGRFGNDPPPIGRLSSFDPRTHFALTLIIAK